MTPDGGTNARMGRTVKGQPVDLILDPPRTVGPLAIGMSLGEAEQALRDIPGFVPPLPGERRAPGFAHYESEMSIAVGTDPRGTVVRSIEVHRPTVGADVRWGDISLFAVEATEVIHQLGRITALEFEDGGRHVVAPGLLLSLWRGTLPEGPEDQDGRYFESILVAAPGYYD